jgi:23S rRNA (pseudouridine1915-N3)-methyltransferase
MKCRLIAAGTRLPDWVNAGFREYQKRLRAPLVLELEEISIAPCRAGENPQPAMAREGERMLAALGHKDHVVALEISGSSMSTGELSVWLNARLRQAKPIALLIGGPNGLSPACLERADESWSLSPLTLPHALVRILVAEQLYRAMSFAAGHPYHRA